MLEREPCQARDLVSGRGQKLISNHWRLSYVGCLSNNRKWIPSFGSWTLWEPSTNMQALLLCFGAIAGLFRVILAQSYTPEANRKNK